MIKLKIIFFILLLYSLFSLFPFGWLIISSFKTDLQIFISPWSLPESFNYINYINAWVKGNFSRYFINSVYITLISVMGGVLFSSMAGYAFSRLRSKLSNNLRQLFLLGLMIPGYVTLIPLFIILKNLGWYDTHLALIIPYIAGSMPINIMLMYATYQNIPQDIDEAAIIDGASPWRVFWMILMPLTRPTAITVFILMFISVWNEFLNVLIFINNPALKTLQAGLMAFRGQYQTDYASLFAALVITIIPIVIIFIVMQDKITKGMAAGAIKS